MAKTRIVVLGAFFVIMAAFMAFADGQKKAPYYVGMTKDELFEIYPSEHQTNYFQKFNADVYTFDDYLSEDEGDTITFCLKEGKIAWWDKNKANPTPEERLKQLTERKKLIKSIPSVTDTGAEQEMKWKQRDRLDGMGHSDTQKQNKMKYST